MDVTVSLHDGILNIYPPASQSGGVACGFGNATHLLLYNLLCRLIYLAQVGNFLLHGVSAVKVELHFRMVHLLRG